MTSESYQNALDYLYGFVDYGVKSQYRYAPEVFDLARVRDLLHRLGDPQDAYPTVHVAGTKGKGSVSALMAWALKEAGYAGGLYTSPHLRRFPERIQVGGREVTETEVAGLVRRLRPHADAVPGLTWFEAVTALAFLHFAEVKVDCAVIEVGLGGRLDATNVITPLVSVITSISYDHMHLLGNRLSDIAAEKAGIIKAGVPVVVAPQQHEVDRVLQDAAEAVQAPVVRVGRDWLFAPGGRGRTGQSFYVWPAAEQPLMDAFVESAGSEEWAPPRYEIPLLGYHQVVNAAVAYAALRVVEGAGLPVGQQAIREGFRSVRWPGRFQILGEEPVVIVDSAHNRDSALKLRIAVDDYFPGQPVTLIFGASSDKDVEGMLAELLPRVYRVLITQAVHPRAADPDLLAELARSHGMRVEVAVPVEQALAKAVGEARPGEVVLATGSLFVAGEVLASWERVRPSESGVGARGT